MAKRDKKEIKKPKIVSCDWSSAFLFLVDSLIQHEPVESNSDSSSSESGLNFICTLEAHIVHSP